MLGRSHQRWLILFLVRWVLARPIGYGNYLRVGLRMAKRPKYITTSHAQITEAIVQDGWTVSQSPVWRINTSFAWVLLLLGLTATLGYTFAT